MQATVIEHPDNSTEVYDEVEIAQWEDLVGTAEAIWAVRSRLKTQGMTDVEIKNLIANSPTECEDCGDEIPQARRVLSPGATLCTPCKDYQERKSKGVRVFQQ